VLEAEYTKVDSIVEVAVSTESKLEVAAVSLGKLAKHLRKRDLSLVCQQALRS